MKIQFSYLHSIPFLFPTFRIFIFSVIIISVRTVIFCFNMSVFILFSLCDNTLFSIKSSGSMLRGHWWCQKWNPGVLCQASSQMLHVLSQPLYHFSLAFLWLRKLPLCNKVFYFHRFLLSFFSCFLFFFPCAYGSQKSTSNLHFWRRLQKGV